MKILLYGINYAPELTGIGKYSGEMAEWFAAQGHEVRVITAPPYYPHWQVAEGFKAYAYRKEFINDVTVLRCPLYIPQKLTTLKRLLHLCSFALSSLPVVLAQWRWQADVIIGIEPTFFCTPASLLLAKASGAKSILHIQDYELDAMLGLGMGKQGRFASLAQWVECFVMRRFSAISSISVSMLRRARVKMNVAEPSATEVAIPKMILFPNWVDIDFVTPAAVEDIFRQKWQISESTKVVLYSGNMGKKQGLELVLEVAECFLQPDDEIGEVVFIFVGTGAAEFDLKQYSDTKGLHNVQFFPLQAYSDLPALMALADVHLVVQKKGVADAVLPSKLTTILSAGGQALITAEAETELGVLCANYPGIATCVEPENFTEFLKALTELLLQVDIKNRVVNQCARDYAEQHLAKEQVLKQFEEDLNKLCVI